MNTLFLPLITTAEEYFSEEEPLYAGLYTAISEQSYPRIYRELDRYACPCSPNAAYFLLYAALDKELTGKAIEAILKRCPPAPEILPVNHIYCLLGRAAYLNRPDVMTLLLERGASPNRTSGICYSPLEAALNGQSLQSIELLMKQPELDTAWTDRLLREWARMDHASTLHDFCLMVMASRFTGWDPISGQPLPIPEPMTLEIISEARNRPLLERFCRERAPISAKEALSAVHIFKLEYLKSVWGEEKEGESACANTLTTLLKSCPSLLRTKKGCQALLRCFLKFHEEAREGLRPWVKGLRRRPITMTREDWLNWGYDGFPEHWRKLLPQGPDLAVGRWSNIFKCSAGSLNVKTLSHVLSVCPIQGGRRKGKISPVAQTVLQYGDVPLIEFLFRQRHGLLAAEDPDALIAYVREKKCPRANRAAALVHVRKAVDYDI